MIVISLCLLDLQKPHLFGDCGFYASIKLYLKKRHKLLLKFMTRRTKVKLFAKYVMSVLANLNITSLFQQLTIIDI